MSNNEFRCQLRRWISVAASYRCGAPAAGAPLPFLPCRMPPPFSTRHIYIKVCGEWISTVPARAWNEINNDKQEIDWISYDVVY